MGTCRPGTQWSPAAVENRTFAVGVIKAMDFEKRILVRCEWKSSKDLGSSDQSHRCLGGSIRSRSSFAIRTKGSGRGCATQSVEGLT